MESALAEKVMETANRGTSESTLKIIPDTQQAINSPVIIKPQSASTSRPQPLNVHDGDTIVVKPNLPYYTSAGIKHLSADKLGYLFTKRLFDIIFSLAVVAILFVPALILCALIMLDSPGAPLFCQKRVGQYGKEIRIFKFRTMYEDAHTNPEKYFTKEQLHDWKTEFKVNEDPRITRIGAFLRKTSLDEIPQFLNVLENTMSVIGVRPIVDDELSAYGNNIDKFLSVKPGITGWWQVAARNDADYESGERQDLELFYANHQSWKLDTTVFFATFLAMAKKTGN